MPIRESGQKRNLLYLVQQLFLLDVSDPLHEIAVQRERKAIVLEAFLNQVLLSAGQIGGRTHSGEAVVAACADEIKGLGTDGK